MIRPAVIPAIGFAALGSVAVWAQSRQEPPPAMSFFVVANPTGTGNLGGIAGADRICQNAAGASGGLNFNPIWHAYLSQEQRGNRPRLDARDRIGEGPWYNAKGVLIASDVADLHGDVHRDRNTIQRATALDAKGNPVADAGQPGARNEYDVITGSDSEGRAFVDGLDHSCNNWAADGGSGGAMLGHMDRNGGGNVSWNSAHMSQGCGKEALNATGGGSWIYCFAID